MIKVFTHSWALMIGMLLIMMGNGLQGTLLGVRGAMEKLDPNIMGYVMAAYFVGFLGGSKIAPILIKNVGHVRVFAAFGSVVSAAFLLYAVWIEPWFWIFIRLTVGFCLAGLYVVAESWLNDISTNETRGQSLSLYLMIQMLGIISGQVLLNFADPGGYLLFILMSVLVSLAFAPILLSASPMPAFETSRPLSLKELYHASPLGLVGALLLGGVFSATFGMSAVYATEQGLTVSETSFFIMIMYLGGMVLQYPIGWLSDRFDRRLLVIAVTALSTLFCALVFWFENTYLLLCIVAFAIGGTANPLYGLFVAHTNDHLENDQMAAASGSLIFVNGVGAMGGPIIVGMLMQGMGPNGFFFFIALLMGVICLYSIYRTTQSEAITADDSLPFVHIGRGGTQIAAEIAAEVVIEEAEQQEEDKQQEEEKQDSKK